MIKLGYIYKHTNIHSGKVYIGQTWQQPSRRWRKNDKTYNVHKNTIALYNALKIDSWDSFTSEILWSGLATEKELNDKEELYIKQFNSLVPNGYNIKNTCNGRQVQSQQTKNKIRQKALGRKGTAKPKYVPYQAEGKTYRKCYKCLKNKELCKENYWQVSVRNGRTYHDGYDKWCIDCKRTYYKGRYDSKKLSEEKKQEVYANRGKLWKERHDTPEMRQFLRNINKKTLLQIDPKTNEVVKEWEAMSDASNELNISKSGISTACSNAGKIYKGFLWKYKT